MCRYSREVLWLQAKSNNNPKTIAYYYLCCVKKLKGLFVVIQTPS